MTNLETIKQLSTALESMIQEAYNSSMQYQKYEFGQYTDEFILFSKYKYKAILLSLSLIQDLVEGVNGDLYAKNYK